LLSSLQMATAPGKQGGVLQTRSSTP
jgi:hypothetical protein